MNEVTTFDEIFTSFLTNCKVSRKLIPTDNEILCEWIDNAVKHYNNMMKQYKDDFQYPLKADMDMEELNCSLTDDEMLIMANIIKLVFLENEKVSFITRYAVFQKELGINNYNAQANARELAVRSQREEIQNIIINALDDWSVY